MQVRERPCGPRKSKKNPTAFSKRELVDLAVSLGMKKTIATRMKMDDLCVSVAGLIGRKRKVKRPTPKKTPRRRRKSSPRRKRTPRKTPRRKTRVVRRTPRKKIYKVVTKKKVKTKVKHKPKTGFSITKILRKRFRKTGRRTFKKVNGQTCIERSNIELKGHQIAPIRYLMTHRGVIVCHGTGSGKTLLAVAGTQCLLDAYPDKRAIIITSKSLRENFAKEMEGYGIDRGDPRYSFYTYEGFMNFAKREGRRGISNVCKDNILVVDEAHNLRTVKKGAPGKKAQAILNCAKNAFRVLLLTATPFVNNIGDILNLVAMVDGTDPLTKSEYEHLSDEDKIRYLSCVFSYYHPTRVDRTHYPEEREHEIFIPMDRDYYEKYRALEAKNLLLVGGADSIFEGKNVWVFLTGVREGCNVLHLENGEKFDFVVDAVKQGGKTVIYSSWIIAGVNMLKERLEKEAGVRVAEYTGKVSTSKRNEAIAKYNSDLADVLIISRAGGEGLDLKGTQRLIIFDPVWNPSTEHQIKGRVARYLSHEHLPESERVVDIYKLYAQKPDEHDRDRYGLIRDPNDNVPSADMILRGIVNRKRNLTKDFMDEINRLSIESLEC